MFMLRFLFEDFRQTHEACLERFKDNLFITALHHAIKEIYLAGKTEYNSGEYIRFGLHNTLGFRLMAWNLASMMIKHALSEKLGMSFNNQVINAQLTGTYPAYDDMKLFLDRLEYDKMLKDLDEPAIRAWCELFQIPFALNVDINTLYYGGEET